MEKKQKVLACGDVEGKFKTLFGRVQAINEKNGPFDFLFCVGDFFGNSPSNWEPYKNGSLKVPVPTYILGPHKPEHESLYEDLSGCEMCPNVSYLGKRGVMTSGGLTIVYVSGFEGKNESCYEFNKADVNSVKEIAMKGKITNNSFLGVDILLSSVWPKNIANNHDDCPFKNDPRRESELLSWLSAHLRPRYHFAGNENVYYERPPYENLRFGDENSVHSSRFIALAKVGGTGKNKWLYAANLTPIEKMKERELYQFTTDQTACPFSLSSLSGKESQQYFYDMNASDDNIKKRKKNSNNEERKKIVFDQSSCWFCLGSPQVEKHLVVSIGEQVYIALAKGGITEYHVMILPVQHHRAYAFISDEIKVEIKKFKSALKKYFKTLKMVPVYFERNYKTSHMQLHVVPIPKSVASKLKSFFLSESEERGIELSELPEHCKLEDSTEPDRPYFYIELPTSERLFCSSMKNLPLEFGRDVLASEEILDLPHRVGWRDCVVSKPEEIKLVENFRTGFKEFDFTVDEDD